MSIRYVYALMGAAVLSCAVALAQTNEQTPVGATGQVGSTDEMPITLVGCLQRESDYRRQNDAGRGGVIGTGLGLGNEYVLINASRAGSAGTAVDCSTATANIGEAYELTGDREKDLEPFVGRRVEIAGMLKEADIDDDDAVGTSGTAAARPEGGFDPLGQDLRLFEVNVMSFREATAPQPIGTSGTQDQPAIAEEAGEPLPRTASPLPIVGLLGLLSLGGGLGLRALRRR